MAAAGVVDGKVIVEVKATEKMPPYAERQLRNFLCATEYRVGLLLHFGPDAKVQRLVDFPKRILPRLIDADFGDN